MQQFAIFVDAGYLCMAGGTLISQDLVNRRNVRLKIEEVMAALISEGRVLANDRPLLRIYWYDGCPNGTRKSAEHSAIEMQPDVKLRMGTINREGRQKGVDTALVLDLVQLAQNRAISDAVIVGGDEDLRGGIVLAQAMGVRVHLLGVQGVDPNQSHDMIADADRVCIWDKDKITTLMSVEIEENGFAPPVRIESEDVDPNIIQAAEEAASRANLSDVVLYWSIHQRGLPADIDGRLLASARGLMGRDLNGDEKRTLRALHTQAIKSRITKERDTAEPA